MILWGVPSLKNNQILTFDFHPSRDPPGPRGTRGARGVRRIKNLHKTKSDRRPILAGVPFIKNVEIPKFWSASRPAPPSGPVFSGCGPKLKIPLPTFCLPCCPDSEKVQHDPPAPNPRRKPAFSGSGPDPAGLGIRVTRTKISCKELSGPSKFCADPSNGSKVFWKV